MQALRLLQEGPNTDLSWLLYSLLGLLALVMIVGALTGRRGRAAGSKSEGEARMTKAGPLRGPGSPSARKKPRR